MTNTYPGLSSAFDDDNGRIDVAVLDLLWVSNFLQLGLASTAPPQRHRNGFTDNERSIVTCVFCMFFFLSCLLPIHLLGPHLHLGIETYVCSIS